MLIDHCSGIASPLWNLIQKSRHALGFCRNRTKPGTGRKPTPTKKPVARISLHEDLRLPTGYCEKLATSYRARHRSYGAAEAIAKAKAKRQRKALRDLHLAA